MPDPPKPGKRRARWIALALLLSIAASIGTIWVARTAVGADTDQLAAAAVDMALAQRPNRSGMSDEQARAQMQPFMRGMLSLYPIMIPIGILVSTVLFGTVLFGAYRLTGVPVGWTMAFAACATGAAGSALVRLAITLLVVLVLQQSISAEYFLDNSIVPLHLAAFLPADIGAVWKSAASKIDLLMFVYTYAVISYLVDEEGLTAHAGKIIGATIACYALWIVLGMLWAAAWSGLGS